LPHLINGPLRGTERNKQNKKEYDIDGNIGMKKENSSVFFNIQTEERKSNSRNIETYYSQGSTRIGLQLPVR
jgi:hypothetical protein